MVHEMQELTTWSIHYVGPNATINSYDMTYIIASNVLSTASILGNFAIFICYYVYKDVRTTGTTLLTSLSFANTIMCIGNLLQVATFYRSIQDYLPERSALCETASLFAVYGNTANALWTDSVVFYVFLAVTLGLKGAASKLSVLFHICSWAMPAIITMCGGIADVYGYDDGFVRRRRRPSACWISNRASNIYNWQMVTIEGWALASYCACAMLYIAIKVINFFRRRRVACDRRLTEDLDKPFTFVPVTFILLRSWTTFYFLSEQYGELAESRFSNGLLLFKGFGESSIGLCNSFLFFITFQPIRRRVTKWFRSKWNGKVRIPDKWKPLTIVRKIHKRRERELDIRGMSLEFPPNDSTTPLDEDEIIFERDDV